MFLKKKKFWGSLIAILLLAYCLKDIRISEIRALSERVNYLYLIPATLAALLYLVTRALRWRLIVAQHKTIPPLRSITLYSAGQILNILMPALTGQVGRMFLFARKENLRKTFVFSTIVLEVLFDAISLMVFLMLTSLAFAFPDEYRNLSLILAVITIALVAGLYLLLHYQQGLEEFGRRRFRHRWPGTYITVKKFIRSFIKGIDLLRSSQSALKGLLFSLVSWGAHMLAIYYLFEAFNLGLPPAAAAAVMIINSLALMIPITPGNAGTFEVAVSTSLVAFSVGRSDAVLFALALHLLDLIPIVILGLMFLRTEKISIREIQAQHEDQPVLDNVSEDGELIEQEGVK